ncbi:unnamed protein product [Laminaria digitata]
MVDTHYAREKAPTASQWLIESDWLRVKVSSNGLAYTECVNHFIEYVVSYPRKGEAKDNQWLVGNHWLAARGHGTRPTIFISFYFYFCCPRVYAPRRIGTEW